MPILTIIIVLIISGVLLFLVNNFIPMQRTIKGILNAVIMVVLVFWLLSAFGFLTPLENIKVNRLGI